MLRCRMISVVCVALWALPARLEASSDVRDVEVLVAPAHSELVSLLKERLARRDWSWSVQPRQKLDRQALVKGQQHAQGLSVYVDLQTRGWARLIFVQPGGERFTIRDLPLGRNLDEVALETIALIVDSAADSLLAGLEFELSRVDAEVMLSRAPEPPAPAPASAPTPVARPPNPGPEAEPALPTNTVVDAAAGQPAVAPPAAPGVRPFLLLGYVATPQGSQALPWLSGPTLSFGLRAKKLWLQSDLTWFMPASLDAPPFSGEVAAAGIRAGAGWHRNAGAWSFAALPVRLGVDAAWLTTQANAGAEAAPAKTYFTPTAGGAIAVHRRLGALVLALTASVDIDLLGTRFTGNDAGVERDLITLWRVRPCMGFSVGWSQLN